MKLVFYTANCTGNAKNCSYPNRVEVTNADELKAAVRMDHVCAEYKNNYRSGAIAVVCMMRERFLYYKIVVDDSPYQ